MRMFGAFCDGVASGVLVHAFKDAFSACILWFCCWACRRYGLVLGMFLFEASKGKHDITLVALVVKLR
jgi:hypothetical protein